MTNQKVRSPQHDRCQGGFFSTTHWIKIRGLSAPLEEDDGEKKEVLCAVYFIHGKNKSPVFSGKVRLPASLFGNESYGFYLRDEEKEAADARAIVERDERRANRKNERDFS